MESKAQEIRKVSVSELRHKGCTVTVEVFDGVCWLVDSPTMYTVDYPDGYSSHHGNWTEVETNIDQAYRRIFS